MNKCFSFWRYYENVKRSLSRAYYHQLETCDHCVSICKSSFYNLCNMRDFQPNLLQKNVRIYSFRSLSNSYANCNYVLFTITGGTLVQMIRSEPIIVMKLLLSYTFQLIRFPCLGKYSPGISRFRFLCATMISNPICQFHFKYLNWNKFD